MKDILSNTERFVKMLEPFPNQHQLFADIIMTIYSGYTSLVILRVT